MCEVNLSILYKTQILLFYTWLVVKIQLIYLKRLVEPAQLILLFVSKSIAQKKTVCFQTVFFTIFFYYFALEISTGSEISVKSD